MSTLITASSLDYGIAEEYIAQLTPIFTQPMVYASMMGEGDFIEEENFDGRAKTVKFPRTPNPTVRSGTIAESTVNTNSTWNINTGLTITIQEYGNQLEKVSGLARLQSWHDVEQRVLNYVGGCAGLTFDDLLASAAVAKVGTGDEAGASDTTDWAVVNPDASHKPQGYISKDEIDVAVIKVRKASKPFADGLFRGVVHVDASYDFSRTLSSTGLDFKEYSLYRQAGVDYPAEYAQSMLGVWGGVLWKVTESTRHVISAGAADGSDAYKTLIYGQSYLGAAFVPVDRLPWNGVGGRIPISKYVEIRHRPDTDDTHNRNQIYTFYFAGGAGVRHYRRGFYWIHKCDYSAPGRA